MVDTVIPIPGNQSVDASAVVQPTSNVVVVRERTVIADDVQPYLFLSIDAFVRTGRQAAEIAMLEAYDSATNVAVVKRVGERGYATDRRGSIGRGSTR
jgi:hypothetical protein